MRRLHRDRKLSRKDRFRDGIGIEIANIEDLQPEKFVEVETGHPLLLPRKEKVKTDREGEHKLGPFKRLVLSLMGYVYVKHMAYPSWHGELPFYAFKCPIHGIVEDYPHGHNYRLECPKCRLEARVLRDLTFGISQS